MSYCENCGQFLNNDMAHCPNCGTKNPEYAEPVPAPDPIPEPEPVYHPVEVNAEPAPAAEKKGGTNILAILGFVASLIPAFAGLISLILSIIGLEQIKKKNFEKPLKGLAIAGLILSILCIIIMIIAIVIFIIAITAGGLLEYFN